MVRTKKQDITITVAIIGAIGVIVGAYLGSPLADTQFQERPIIGVSFSDWSNQVYPKEYLENDGTNYFVKILANNSGKSKGRFFVTVIGINAKVSFFKNDEFTYQKSLDYSINPQTNYTILEPPIFVLPDNNSTFTIQLTIVNSVNQNPFQELDPFTPTQLTYDYTDTGFKLIDKK